MKITRIEKEGKGEWQITLSDDEITEIIKGLITASLASARAPILDVISELTVIALCTKARDQKGIADDLNASRDRTIPRFVLDATAIIKKREEEES